MLGLRHRLAQSMAMLVGSFLAVLALVVSAQGRL